MGGLLEWCDGIEKMARSEDVEESSWRRAAIGQTIGTSVWETSEARLYQSA